MNRIRTSQLLTAMATAAAVAIAVAIGWALAAAGDPPVDPAAAPAAEASATPGGPASGSPPTQGPDSQPDSTAPPGQSGSGGQPGQPAEGPRIDLFQVTQEPRCPAGTSQNPIPGQPVTLEWRVTGADEVSISIDGPGVFDTYPAEGGATVPFGCDGNPGDMAEHSFLLTAEADGQTATETIVVSARVNDVPTV